MENYSKGALLPEKFSICVCDRVVGCELNEEFTLPDYRPEIRKLLRVTPTFAPASVYFGAGRLEFGGGVSYRVLYCGEDGKLYSVDLPANYSFDTETDEDAGLLSGVVAMADIAPDSVTGRVIAPRKIAVRTGISAHVRGYADTEAPLVTTGLDDAATQRRLVGTGEYANILRGSLNDIVISDDLIPDSREGEIRVIQGEGSVFVSEATVANGCVMCRGDVMLRLLMCREPGDGVEILTRKLPFAKEIPIAGVAPGWECRAWGDCSAVSTSVGDGRIACDVTLCLEAEAQSKQSFNYTKDIYSTAAETEAVKCEVQLIRPLRAANGNFTQSAVLELGEAGLPAGATIIDTKAAASVQGIESEHSRCVVTGEVRYNILYSDGEGYGCCELASPLRYETDPGQDAPESGIQGDARLTVLSSRARMDGERVSVDCEVGVALRACCADRIKTVSEARFSPVTASGAGDVVVCYPDSGDTLWSVARRYRADAEHICHLNSLKPQTPDCADSLEGARFLIV